MLELPGYGLGFSCMVASWGHAGEVASFKGVQSKSSQVSKGLDAFWQGNRGWRVTGGGLIKYNQV